MLKEYFIVNVKAKLKNFSKIFSSDPKFLTIFTSKIIKRTPKTKLKQTYQKYVRLPSNIKQNH